MQTQYKLNHHPSNVTLSVSRFCVQQIRNINDRDRINTNASSDTFFSPEEIRLYLEEHHAAQKLETERLSSLLHPFKHCPEDILRNIFECLISIAQYSYDSRKRKAWLAATKLSHVCRNWRIIALNTPYIWSFIEASQVEDLGLVRRLFDAAAVRSQFRPANILLFLDNPQLRSFTEANDEFARACAIYRISKIDTLQLKLDCSEDITRLSDYLRSSSLETLSISVDQPKQLVESHLDCCDILGAFPTTKHLTFWGLEGISFANGASNVALRSLEIYDGSMSFQGFNISIFTQLEELYLNTRGYISETVYLTKLRKADINTNFSTWSKLITPQLEVLQIYYVNRDVLNYLSQTSSIRTLVIELHGDLDEKSIRNLASLSNLTSLKINMEYTTEFPIIKVLNGWEQSGLRYPPFPNLMEMELDKWRPKLDCLWDDLNAFVQGYYGIDSPKERVFKLRLSAYHYFYEEGHSEPLAQREALKQALVLKTVFSACIGLVFQWPIQAQT